MVSSSRKINAQVYVIDVCHMIQLMRNLLGDYKTIYGDKGGKCTCICWQYIEALNDLQKDLGFSLANKLKKGHILWTNECQRGCSDIKCLCSC